MTGILDRQRTITLRGRPYRVESFASLTELADAHMRILQDGEAKMAMSALSATEWTDIADTADALAEICREQEAWLAEHDTALAIEADAIRADIRKLTSTIEDADH